MMDLDGLKAVNDRFGHFHGDRALRTVGETIRAGVRRIDTAARYGGDEFVVVLPETEPTGAFVLAEKIRLGVGERALMVDGLDVRTSLSIGVVVYPRDGRTVDDLMIAADTTMYRSKRQGATGSSDRGSRTAAAWARWRRRRWPHRRPRPLRLPRRPRRRRDVGLDTGGRAGVVAGEGRPDSV